MLIIGLTGIPCSGKSSALKIFAAEGAHVFSSDELVAGVMRDDKTCREDLLESFGGEILSDKGEIRRDILRQKVLQNPKALLKLEQIIHPRVRQRWIKALKELPPSSDVVVYEVPLLFETQMNELVDKSVCISIEKEKQTKQARERGMSEELLAIFNSRQFSNEEKARLSDFVIPNNGSMDDLKIQIKNLYQQLLSLVPHDEK